MCSFVNKIIFSNLFKEKKSSYRARIYSIPRHAYNCINPWRKSSLAARFHGLLCEWFAMCSSPSLPSSIRKIEHNIQSSRIQVFRVDNTSTSTVNIEVLFHFSPAPNDLDIGWQNVWDRDENHIPVPRSWMNNKLEIYIDDARTFRQMYHPNSKHVIQRWNRSERQGSSFAFLIGSTTPFSGCKTKPNNKFPCPQLIPI